MNRIPTIIQLSIFMMLITCNGPEKIISTPEPGISWTLAQQRKAVITDLKYRLHFAIPETLNEQIPASLVLSFQHKNGRQPVVLDFKESEDHIVEVKKGDQLVEYTFENGHVILPASQVNVGLNDFEIKFITGELSLNRSEEYLYTLLVPDRSSTVFPCFDQPNLKAVFELSLEIPLDWQALSNGQKIAEVIRTNHQEITFAPTKPISTYVFAFTAGRFNVETRDVRGRTMSLYYRESDPEKIARNLDPIFDLHASALEWMEAYTGIPYAFEKFDFMTVPTFQYGGMEHVGAIFYRESSLFLDKAATQNQLLGRASLIAHETAHMWFGDLVTMDWFDDVWLKEVFANFMAAKIVNPTFPEVDHQLRFLMAHQPAAYSEDRSLGSHPIQQPLENLKDAGTLYGRIIYQKAPVVMMQLEEIVGEQSLREGLRKYLHAFSFGNAAWDDLIRILDDGTAEDLRSWSTAWVKQGGMPSYQTRVVDQKEEGRQIVEIVSTRRSDEGQEWDQKTQVVLVKDKKYVEIDAKIGGRKTEVNIPTSFKNPDFVLANGWEGSYGYFGLDEASRAFLLAFNLSTIDQPQIRGAAWLTLQEEMLRKKIAPEQLLNLIMSSLPEEKEPLNYQYVLGVLDNLYWQFLTPDQRERLGPSVENLLWEDLWSTRDDKRKIAFFRAYRSIAISAAGVDRLVRLWSEDLEIPNLSLSEFDFTEIASELAVREVVGIDTILTQQLERIQNSDSRKRFAFLLPVLSSDPVVRDTFFESLKKAENRHYEPWVGAALSYLHHPLRSASAVRYILPGLELMEEIQETGDIFFPKRWISAILNGHQSPEAAEIVLQFLANRPDYPYRLKNKILQASDDLLRSSSTGMLEE